MRLKDYQERVLSTLTEFLTELSSAKKDVDVVAGINRELAKQINFPKQAWGKVTNKPVYHMKTNGLGEPLPDIYLKVPTGGGKTLLACHSIDLINKHYLNRQTGLVLWIVPSNQIYRQTIAALKNREHPYRQILDISSGGRTLIKEKHELFSRMDVEENLLVLMLMLPSANRQNKETLRLFRDSGGFTDFFPPDDSYTGHKALKELTPNLDCFSTENEIFGTLVKTSLGNTLKILKPLVIIDEGHKAYSEGARNTITEFNPSFVLELSATPPQNANELVRITGRELHDEEMIKLDINLINKSSTKWQDTILASLEKLNELEKKAKEYHANTGQYIRPACLIQVERTGKEHRDDARYIHAEQVKEFLLAKCNIPNEQIAIKSSEKDDIEGINLFAEDCPIRFIITKQALQEGWDFSYAYILTILTNPQSPTAITQLVGRILRQPYAKKTRIKTLDECYVYTFKQHAGRLVRDIKAGLESEGLGDIAGRIVTDGPEANTLFHTREVSYRPGFKKFEGKIFLPRFVIQEKHSWRDVRFEQDILSAINWEAIKLDGVHNIHLNPNQKSGEINVTIGYPEESWNEIIERGITISKGTLEIDEVFLARQLGDLIPNPWIAFEKGEDAMAILKKKYPNHAENGILAANFVFIIEELKKIIEAERDRLAEEVFRKMIDEKRICFFILQEHGSHQIPSRITIKGNRLLNRLDGTQIQRSLFEQHFEEEFNETERNVAVYLDEQEKLLWWYRNISKQNYHIQGWRKNKIYPDFIATEARASDPTNYDTVYVLETKGVHLKANADTRYKEDIFKLCNELGAKKAWKELINEFPDHNFEFQVIFEDEWQNKINELLET